MRIIILEDEAISMMFISDVLEDLGHSVIGTFDNSKDLLECVDNKQTDLVFLDININDTKTGIDIAQDLKSRSIPFIFITSYKDSETIKKATALEPIGYLIKPIDQYDIEAITEVSKRSINPHCEVEIAPEYFCNEREKLLFHKGEPVSLGEKECLCLEILVKNRNSYVSSEKIIEFVWSDEVYTDRSSSLRELISRIKKRVSTITIENLPRIGYSLKVEE